MGGTRGNGVDSKSEGARADACMWRSRRKATPRALLTEHALVTSEYQAGDVRDDCACLVRSGDLVPEERKAIDVVEGAKGGDRAEEVVGVPEAQ